MIPNLPPICSKFNGALYLPVAVGLYWQSHRLASSLLAFLISVTTRYFSCTNSKIHGIMFYETELHIISVVISLESIMQSQKYLSIMPE